MSTENQSQELDQKYGFTGIFTILENTLKLVKKVDVAGAITKLHDNVMGNDTVKGLVPKLMEEANGKIAIQQKKLDGYTQKNTVLTEVNKKLADLKKKMGFNDSDMVHTPIQPFGRPVFLGSTVAIILVDFLIGGIALFAFDQSYQVAGLLMLGAILPAILFAKAAPSFAVSKRLKAEIDQANNLLKRINSGNSILAKQDYKTNPEKALSLWMRPSSKALSHKYGIVTYDTTVFWKINVNHAWSWVWLALGSIFSFIRVMPVLARPELYDDKTLIRQFVLLVIALIVNFAIFALERERRGEVGLPDDLQKQINALLKSKERAVKESPDKADILKAEKEITKLQKDVTNKLDIYYNDYSNEFTMIVEGASHYDDALRQYTAIYGQHSEDLRKFYEELRTIGGDPSDWQKQIPSPEIVGNMYSQVANPETLKLDKNVFTFKIEKEEPVVEVAAETVETKSN